MVPVCKTCNIGFRKWSDLRMHTSKSHSRHCDICCKLIGDEEQLIQHFKSKHLNSNPRDAVPSHTCKKCGYKDVRYFKKNDDARISAIKVQKKLAFTHMVYCENNICQVCKRGFEHENDLKTHVTNYLNEGKCEQMVAEFDVNSVSTKLYQNYSGSGSAYSDRPPTKHPKDSPYTKHNSDMLIDSEKLAARLVKILPKTSERNLLVNEAVDKEQFQRLLNKVTGTSKSGSPLSRDAIKPVFLSSRSTGKVVDESVRVSNSRDKSVSRAPHSFSRHKNVGDRQCHFCDLRFGSDDEFLEHLKSAEHITQKTRISSRADFGKYYQKQNKTPVVVVPARVLANSNQNSKTSSPRISLQDAPSGFPLAVSDQRSISPSNFTTVKKNAARKNARNSPTFKKTDKIPSSWKNIQGKFACSQCEEVYSYAVEFRDHLIQTHKYTRNRLEDDVVRVCGECDTGFTRYFDLAQHLQIQHDAAIDYNFNVANVNSETTNGTGLKIDSDSDDEIDKLIIDKFKNPEKTSLTEKNFEGGFQKRHDHNVGRSLLSEEKRVLEKYDNCPLCILEVPNCSTVSAIRKHIITSHLTCKICKKLFNTVEELVIHINEDCDKSKAFSKKKQYCTLCGLKFIDDDALKFHLNLHTNKNMTKSKADNIFRAVSNVFNSTIFGGSGSKRKNVIEKSTKTPEKEKTTTPSPPKKKRKLIVTDKNVRVPRLTTEEILKYQILVKADLKMTDAASEIRYSHLPELETSYNSIAKVLSVERKRQMKEFDLIAFLLEDFGSSKEKTWCTIVNKIAEHKFKSKNDMVEEFIDHLVKAKIVVEQEYDMKNSSVTCKNEAITTISNLMNACNDQMSAKSSTRRRAVTTFAPTKCRINRQLQRMLDRGYFSPNIEIEKYSGEETIPDNKHDVKETQDK